MKVLVISMDSVGEGLAFAVRCQQSGHAVRLWLGKEANPTIGSGFKGIERVDNWLSSVKWADLILPTGNHSFMSRLDALRADGAPIFGPSVKSAALEIKRSEGLKFLEAHDIECPTYQAFKTLDEALAHVKKTEARYVFKTMGDEDDKSLSYCSKSPADMVARIERWKKLGLTLKGPCMLQEFIEGIEFAVSRWVGKEGFIGLPNENFERKKLMPGDHGPNTGEMGTVLKYVRESKLQKSMLEPLEDDLVKLGHLGDVDVNCIIDKSGKAWPLEFTCRLGWPAFNIMTALHKGDPAQWMVDAINGEDTIEVSPKVAVGVVLAQPDYPYSKATKAETDGVPIYGVTEENQKYLSPQSIKIESMPVMQGEKLATAPTWVSAGDYLLVATKTAKTVRGAAEGIYSVIKELHVPDLIYRDDIAEKMEEAIPKLKAMGYALEFDYG